MPCPIAPAPAALFIPLPWQAPFNWLTVVALAAVVGLIVVWGHRHKANRARTGAAAEAATGGGQFPQHWTQLPLWLRSIFLALNMAALTILVLVTMPSQQRSEAWYHSQFIHFASSNLDCSLSASNLFTITAAHQQATLVTNWIAIGFSVLSWLLVLLFLRARYLVAWSRTWLVHPR